MVVLNVGICGFQVRVDANGIDRFRGDEQLGYFLIIVPPDFRRDAEDLLCVVIEMAFNDDWHHQPADVFELKNIKVSFLFK